MWNVTTHPTTEPITLSEARLFLKVDTTDDNDLITELIKAARQWCENYDNRSYITQTITLKLDSFPHVIKVPRPKLLAVASINYIDTDGNSQLLSDSLYIVDISSEPGRIKPAYREAWPSTRSIFNAVTIIYTAGYGATASYIPERVKIAIKILLGHWYEHRESVVIGVSAVNVPLSVEAMLSDRTF